MVRFVVIVAGLLLVAAIATYGRYQSLHPCDWMEEDLAAQSNLEVHREGAVMFQKMSDEGIAEIVMFVFFARDDGPLEASLDPGTEFVSDAAGPSGVTDPAAAVAQDSAATDTSGTESDDDEAQVLSA